MSDKRASPVKNLTHVRRWWLSDESSLFEMGNCLFFWSFAHAFVNYRVSFVCPFVHSSVHPSIHFPVRPSVRPSIHFPVRPSICSLSFGRPSVCYYHVVCLVRDLLFFVYSETITRAINHACILSSSPSQRYS